MQRLHDSLSDPTLRAEAMEALRSLIEKVIITPEGDGFSVDLYGELGALITLAERQKQKRPGEISPGRSLSVVAGTGFEPVTFRL